MDKRIEKLLYRKFCRDPKFCKTPNKLTGEHGIRYINGYAVATNRYIVAVVKCEYPESYEGKVIGSDRLGIKAPFPDHTKLPSDRTPVPYVNVESLVEVVNEITEKDGILYIKLPEISCSFSVEQLKTIFRLFKYLKEPFGLFYKDISAVDTMLFVESKNHLAVTMSCYAPSQCKTLRFNSVR